MPAQPFALPDSAGPPAGPGVEGWAGMLLSQVNPGVIAAALTAVTVGGLTVHLARRRPARSKDAAARARMYAPLLLVNAAAVYGQVAFFYDRLAPNFWPTTARLALALLVAAAVESIAVYVGWHAHDALLNKASATAAKLRRRSYALAALVGAINYAHFAAPGMRPTAAAVAFGLLSLLSPWLWGLHTRRLQHVQLTVEGVLDGEGATFGASRLRHFPIRTWRARRWSIDHNVRDPVAAWEGYRAERDRARRCTPAGGRLRVAFAALRGAPAVPPAGDAPQPAGRATGTAAAGPPARQPSAARKPPQGGAGTAGPQRPRNAPATTAGKERTISALTAAATRHPGAKTSELAQMAQVSFASAERYLPQIRAAAKASPPAAPPPSLTARIPAPQPRGPAPSANGHQHTAQED